MSEARKDTYYVLQLAIDRASVDTALKSDNFVDSLIDIVSKQMFKEREYVDEAIRERVSQNRESLTLLIDRNVAGNSFTVAVDMGVNGSKQFSFYASPGASTNEVKKAFEEAYRETIKS